MNVNSVTIKTISKLNIDLSYLVPYLPVIPTFLVRLAISSGRVLRNSRFKSLQQYGEILSP